MSTQELRSVDRFLQTLGVVQRQGRHLAYSWSRLYCRPIDVDWVHALESMPERAERLEAFVSRYARMQDTIGDRLLPRWLSALAESPGSLIETLNRAERLGVVENVERWLQARALRNRLVHEYMDNAGEFAHSLNLAKEYSALLLDTFNRVREFAGTRMRIDEAKLADRLALPR